MRRHTPREDKVMVEAESALLPHDALLPRDMRRALPIALLRARELSLRVTDRYFGLTI